MIGDQNKYKVRMYKMELSRKVKDVVRRAARRPHSLVFAIVWLVTTIALIVMLSGGVRRTGQYEAARRVLHVVYVAALLWYLVREGPSLKELPEIEPLLLRRRPAIGRWIPVVGVALALALAALGQGGALTVVLLLPIAVVWTLVARRREIRLRPLFLALALTALAFLDESVPIGTEIVRSSSRSADNVSSVTVT